jgi:proteasome lid subunit RPN8/RPN11
VLILSRITYCWEDYQTKKALFIKQSVLDSIRSYAKIYHPDEGILLLKGKNERDKIVIDEVEIPPLSLHGKGFSNFPLHMLPIDFSIIGTAHSHPSGIQYPSIVDLNNFYSKIMIITTFPYETNQDIHVYNREGKSVKYKTIVD